MKNKLRRFYQHMHCYISLCLVGFIQLDTATKTKISSKKKKSSNLVGKKI